jgi:uncharacterized Zn-finger protein
VSPEQTGYGEPSVIVKSEQTVNDLPSIFEKSEQQDYLHMYYSGDSTEMPRAKTGVHSNQVNSQVSECKTELPYHQDQHQTCDSDMGQDDVKFSVQSEYVCLKHEHTKSEDEVDPCDMDTNVKVVDNSRTREPEYNCDKCTKSFSTKVCLRIHDLVSHVRAYKPETCVQSFTRTDNIAAPNMNDPTDDKPYKCKQCMKSFTRKSSLGDHMKLHTGDKPYKCDRCKYSCTVKSELVKHIHIHQHHSSVINV